MEISKITSDIDIKSIPDEELQNLPPELSDLVNSGKIIGGIFGDKSIRFNDENDYNKLSFIPDTTNVKDYSFKKNKGGNNDGGDGGMSDLERRVQNLETETQKMREQLSEIKYQNNAILSKLENTVSKSDLFQFQNTIISSQSQSINQLPSLSDIKVIISEEMKNVPSTNDIKNIISDVITEKKLATETKVENMLMKQRHSTIKYVVGTGIAVAGLIFTYIRFFVLK